MREHYRYGSLHAIAAGMILCMCGCDASQTRSPAAFSPTRETVRADGRIARCNTVHSLTLPAQVIGRYELSANDDTAIISCSLQESGTGLPVNIPAQVAGTQTTLTGLTSSVDFKEVLEEAAVTYVAQFSIAGKLGIDFRIVMVEPMSGARYMIDLRQEDLPGRL